MTCTCRSGVLTRLVCRLCPPAVSDKDLYKLPGVQTFSHGPYLDDWSKVPDEIAMKYNTSPQNLKK